MKKYPAIYWIWALVNSPMVTLSDCANLVREKVDPTTISEVPYIGLEHIGQGTLHLIEYGSSKDVGSTKTKFKKGDILFGKLRPYFRKVIKAPFDGVCSTDIWVVRAKEGYCQDYIFYWMADQTFINHSMAGSEGTKMPRAKWDHVIQFERSYVSLPTQERIADILGTLDDKIELNRQMNCTLEAMARAIFKSWFVDFDPVYAKMEGREYPLPSDVMDLFPDELVESELGLIPKGWKVGKIGDIAKRSKDGINPYDNPDTKFHHYSIPAYDSSLFPILEKGELIRSRKYLVKTGSILLSKLNPATPRVWLAIPGLDNPICSTEFLVYLPKKGFSRIFLYGLFKSKHFLDILASYVTGTSKSHQRVKPNDIVNMQIVLPPKELLEFFNRVSNPGLERIICNTKQTQALLKIRDTLLQKLISGEIELDS